MTSPRWWTALLLAALAVAGCQRGDRSGAGDAEEAVFRAGIVRPASLDPALALTVDEQLVADQLYDSLVALDPRSSEPIAGLAASWTSTADQRQWDFVLRADARFVDGRAVTSADVKATLDRIVRKGSGSTVADLLEPVSGYAAVALEGSSPELSGVTAPAPGVVHFELDQPWSALPIVLANPAFGVLPRAEASSELRPGASVGSGPFLMAERSDGRLVLVPASRTESRLQRLELMLYDNPSASFAAFEAGLVDWSAVPSDRAAEAGRRHGMGLFRPYAAEVFYAMNLKHPRFADARLREAVVRAVDRRRIIAEVYRDAVLPLDGLVMAGVPGHQDRPCGDRCDYSPERARALVAEVAAEAGGARPEVQVDFEDEPIQAAVASIVRDGLASAGIAAGLRPRPSGEYQRFTVTGEHEMFRLGWVAPYASADAVLGPLVLGGSPNNVIGMSVHEVDDPLRRARASAGGAEQLELYREAERVAMAQMAVVPIAQFQLLSVASPRVRGLELTVTGTFDGRAVWLARGG